MEGVEILFLGGESCAPATRAGGKGGLGATQQHHLKNEWATGDNENKKFTEWVTRGRCDCKLSAKLGKNQLLG